MPDVAPRIKSPRFSSLIVEKDGYHSTTPGFVGGDSLGVMADSDFDDLNDNLDDEVVELRPKNRGSDSLELLVREMAMSQKKMAESQSRMTDFQVQLARNSEDAQNRQTDAIKLSTAIQQGMTKQIIDQIDDRFDQLAKGQQAGVPATLGARAQFYTLGVEALQMFFAMVKKSYEE